MRPLPASIACDECAEHSFLTPAGVQAHPHFEVSTHSHSFVASSWSSSTLACNVECRGDLLHKCYLVFTLPRVTGRDLRWCTDVGFALIDKVSLVIGGQTVDEQTGEFMSIWCSLTQTRDEMANLSDMVNAEENWRHSDELDEQQVYVPLCFSFCYDTEHALPHMCLNPGTVVVTLETRPLCSLLEGEVAKIHAGEAVTLACDHITLGYRARQLLSNGSQDHLVHWTQTLRFAKWDGPQDLELKHECTELFIVCRSLTQTKSSSEFYNFTDMDGKNPIRAAALTFDGHRTEMTGKYMNVVQPFQYHTGRAPAGVNVLSYCLRPEQQVASGSCNMSGFSRVTLDLDLQPYEDWAVTVYARCHAHMSTAPGDRGTWRSLGGPGVPPYPLAG